MKQFIYATCFWFIIAFVVVGLYNMKRYDYEGNITVETDTFKRSDIKGLDFEGSYVIIHYENGYHRAISNADITWSK